VITVTINQGWLSLFLKLDSVVNVDLTTTCNRRDSQTSMALSEYGEDNNISVMEASGKHPLTRAHSAYDPVISADSSLKPDGKALALPDTDYASRSGVISGDLALRAAKLGVTVSLDARAYIWGAVYIRGEFFGWGEIKFVKVKTRALTVFNSLAIFGIRAPIVLVAFCFTSADTPKKYTARKPVNSRYGADMQLGNMVSIPT
jgi:hypothetical protein